MDDWHLQQALLHFERALKEKADRDVQGFRVNKFRMWYALLMGAYHSTESKRSSNGRQREEAESV
jgi:hypothetical protein